jgi:hypothetical protein
MLALMNLADGSGVPDSEDVRAAACLLKSGLSFQSRNEPLMAES